jgi:hypothetical protein
MRYYPKKAVGVEMNDEVAEDLGLLEQWEEWDGDQYESALMEDFESKYGVTPERLITFKDERGGEVSGVTGFEDGVTYLLFDKNESGDEWEALLDILSDKQIDLVKGSWSQLS